MQAVILAGGSGKRLWPISTVEKPKLFLKLDRELSLIQETYSRIKKLEYIDDIITISNIQYTEQILQEYQSINNIEFLIKNSTKNRYNFISEPISRNTSAAITVAAKRIAEEYGEDELILVTPSDHIIRQQTKFSKSVQEAINVAKNDKIVLFGIQPSAPNNNYGYVHFNPIKNDTIHFIEKPSIEYAKELIEKNYLWNSGMFCFKAGVFLEEMKKYAQAILHQVENCVAHSRRFTYGCYDDLRLDYTSFSVIKDSSIDYELMEKTQNLSLIKAEFDWQDIGDWHNFTELNTIDNIIDDNGNRIHGDASVNIKDTNNCYIQSNGKKLAVIGVDDLLIINDNNGILVAKKGRGSEVKSLLSESSFSEYCKLEYQQKN